MVRNTVQGDAREKIEYAILEAIKSYPESETWEIRIDAFKVMRELQVSAYHDGQLAAVWYCDAASPPSTIAEAIRSTPPCE